MFPDRPKDEVFSKYYTPVLGTSYHDTPLPVDGALGAQQRGFPQQSPGAIGPVGFGPWDGAKHAERISGLTVEVR